jgi:hypothetical protein
MDDKTKQEQKVVAPQSTNIHKSGEGFNLIAPRLEEVEKETEKKFKLDIRVVLFVFFVVLVSLGVVGYNWYVSQIFYEQEERVLDLEDDLMSYKHTVEANNQILERYDLYKSINSDFISSKEVLTFWQEISKSLGEIRTITLSNGVNFEVSGKGESLKDVTKLWHFLSIDDRVTKVTLESVSIPARDAEDPTLSFSFKGTLNLEYFNKKK